MSTLAQPFFGKFCWYCASTTPPPGPPPGVTTPGIWSANAFKTNGTVVWATMFRWIPTPPTTAQVVANGSGGSVLGVFLGNLTSATHWPYPPDYPGYGAADNGGLKTRYGTQFNDVDPNHRPPFTDGPTGPGIVLTVPWVSGSGQTFTDIRGRSIQTVPAVTPNAPPSGMSGGQWYAQNGLYVYAAPGALGSSNTAVWVAIGLGVAGTGAAAAFL